MTVRAANLDIYLMRGDDYPYEFNITNSDGTTYNSQNSTITMTIKNIVDGDLLFQYSAIDATLGNDFAIGKYVFVIPSATTSTINQNAVYDIQETTAVQKKNTIVYGKVLLVKNVTA